jgi:hypothetical protein
MTYEYNQKRYELREDATPDVVAEYVRSVLSMPHTRVEKITIEAGSPEQPFPAVTVDMHVEKLEPPDGAVPEMEPGNIWEMLPRIEMIEVDTAVSLLRHEAVHQVIVTMMDAARDAHAPVGWVVGNGGRFIDWIMQAKYNTRKIPSTFLGLPLVESHQVGDDRLIMLCSRSNRDAMTAAKWGYAIVMEGSDVGK